MASSDLLNRDNWSVRPWIDRLPVRPDMCAMVLARPSSGEVHVLINPHAETPCDLAHLPDDVAEHVGNLVHRGPDQGWQLLPWDSSTYLTGLLPGDSGPLPASRVQLTPDELDFALRAQD